MALASPAAVASVLVDGVRDRTLLGHLGVSLSRLVISMVAAGAAGVVLGVLVGISRHLALFVEPLAGVFNPPPRGVGVAVAPPLVGGPLEKGLVLVGDALFFPL